MASEGKRINPMARRVIYGVVGLLVLAVAGALVLFAFREQIFLWSINPAKPFEAFTPPPAPDYALAPSWAALPFKDDFSDFRPDGAAVDQEGPPADVFFIHPTTFLSRTGWNGPITDPRAAALVDQGVMKHQASAFNGCCRVFAPRYRQATFYYTIAKDANSWKALALSYEDVGRAFRHYLDHWNKDRPFILAAHSQGARHLLHLLEADLPPNAAQRLVAAYVVGFGVPQEKIGTSLGKLHVCDGPQDTACLLAWTTIEDGGSDARYRDQMVWQVSGNYRRNGDRTRVCVNPLSWSAGGAPAETDAALALPYVAGTASLAEPVRAVRRAQCRDGVLYINRPLTDDFTARVLKGGDYHVYDYSLFYMAVRRNAQTRVDAFLKKNAQP
jgi:hypothetical protein